MVDVKTDIEAQEKFSAKPLSTFKNRYLENTADGGYILKDYKNLANKELAEVYKQYRTELTNQGLLTLMICLPR